MKDYRKVSALSLIGILFVSSIAVALPENPEGLVKRAVKKEVASEEVLPMTYAQVGATSEGAARLRFATPINVKEATDVTYTRSIDGMEDNVVEVKSVYKGIEADGTVYYYDGNNVTEEPVEGDYYWANYMIEFAAESSHKSTMITAKLDVDGKEAPFLTTSYNAVASADKVTATFVDENGTLLGRSVVISGDVPVYAGEALEEGYCWSDGEEYYEQLPVIEENTQFEIVESPYNEENVYMESLDNIGDYVLEKFGDKNNPVLNISNAEAPNTKIITNGIESCSLAYESSGNFTGPYITFKPEMLKVGSTYRMSFDYKLVDLPNTIYFQYYNDGVPTFKQFGLVSDIGQVKHFEFDVNVTSTDFVIKIFPGAGEAITRFIMDNFKVEKVEQNVYKTSLDNPGDYVLETFGDKANQILTIDNYQTPNTTVVSDGIIGSSLSFVSPGNFACVYLKPNAGLLKVGNSYKVSFDYKITEFADTIYFQYYNGSAPSFTQFGGANQIGQLLHFEYTVQVTDANFLFQIFPGGSTNPTSFIMDNFRIELI